MKKITEHTYSSHIFMRLELDGAIEEITCYCGLDCTWNHYTTTADGDTARREKIISAFKELY
jgi:hypothetical protein